MEFFAPSEKKVVINIASIEESMALKDAIVSEFARSGIKIDVALESLNSASDIDFDVASIARLVALIDSSPVVRDRILDCLKKCTHDREKITLKTFEPEDYRQDYYPVMMQCLKVNLAPFFKGPLSKFAPFLRAYQSRMQSLSENQKSSSPISSDSSAQG